VALVAAGGTAVVVHEREAGPPQSPPPNSNVTSRAQPQAPAAAAERSTTHKTTGAERAESVASAKGKRDGQERADRRKHPNNAAESAPGQLKARGEPARPVKPEHATQKRGNGRGPIEAPPKDTPVRRGPPEPKVKVKVNEQAAPKLQKAPGKADEAEGRGPKLE
jgi:hypothetical protein